MIFLPGIYAPAIGDAIIHLVYGLVPMRKAWLMTWKCWRHLIAVANKNPLGSGAG
jgi:hypothetical protein